MKKQTYDIVNVGERNRFFVRAGHGQPAVCVHNCGYGQGGAGFQKYALVSSGINLTLEEAKSAVTKYRTVNSAISRFWDICNAALNVMADGGTYAFGGPNNDLFFADGSRVLFGRRVPGIRLPNGLWLNYPNLRREPDDKGRPQLVYDVVGYNKKPMTTKVYGGKLDENLIQALAFAIMKWQAIRINRSYPVKMNTHDEWAVVVPLAAAEHASQVMAYWMTQAPEWAAGLPLGCEGGYAQSYGAVDDKWSARPNNPNREHRFNPETGEVE